MAHDPRCAELAKVFLEQVDIAEANFEREKCTKDLADHIQQAIEEFIEFDVDRYRK